MLLIFQSFEKFNYLFVFPAIRDILGTFLVMVDNLKFGSILYQEFCHLDIPRPDSTVKRSPPQRVLDVQLEFYLVLIVFK